MTNHKTEKNDEEDDEFVIDKIITLKVDRDKRHNYANFRESLYRISWYVYSPSDETWEPIDNLPRSKVLSCFKRKKRPISPDIDR